MRLFFILIWTLSAVGVAFAQPNYQIDLILIDHAKQKSLLDAPPDALPQYIHARKLTNKGNANFSLLPYSQSGLKNEYYLLNKKSPYRILARYSWKQPASNKEAVILPEINQDYWHIQGTVAVRKGSYFTFEPNLHCVSKTTQTSFMLSQKQRLQRNEVYFLDHPQIAMLVLIR